MSAGLTIINDYGSVTIDENYKNYRLVTTGTVRTSAEWIGYSYANLQFSGTAPMLAIRHAPQSRSFGVTMLDYFNGAFTATLIADGVNTTLNYYIFDVVPDNVAAGGFLQVRDAQGRLTFDSNFKYLRLVDFIVDTVGTSARTAPYKAGSQEAAVFCTPHIDQDGGSGGYSTWGSAAIYQNGVLAPTRIFMQSVDTSDGGNVSTNEPTYHYPNATMIVDVTGY